ncbi:Olfactory receptor [Mactra antiquata]
MNDQNCQNFTNISANVTGEFVNVTGSSPCQSIENDVHVLRPSFGQTPPPCGYCDIECVYNGIKICYIVGVFANALVIARVCRDRKLRDPTFVGIAALAVADLLFLVLNLTVAFERVIISMQCIKPVLISRPWYILNSMIWFAANSHVALLAILRYLTIVYPIRCTVYLTPGKVVLLSMFVWVLGILLLGTLSVLITVGIVLPGTSGEFVIIWWITVYIIPLLVTVILHILKLLRVKRSANEATTIATRRSISRMSKIVPLVIAMATILPLPKLVYNCLRATNNEVVMLQSSYRVHIKGTSELIYLINYIVNPFIYGFLSKKFRRSIKEMFNCMFGVCYGNNGPKNTRRNLKHRHISVETISTGIGSVSSTDGTDFEGLSPTPGMDSPFGRQELSRSVSNSCNSV